MGRSNGRLRRKPGDDHSGLRWLHPPVALRPAPVRGHGTDVFQIKPTPDLPRESRIGTYSAIQQGHSAAI